MTEEANRLSNIKYVVDQVNTVNSDISTQFSSSNSAIFKSLSDENTEIINKHEYFMFFFVICEHNSKS